MMIFRDVCKNLLWQEKQQLAVHFLSYCKIGVNTKEVHYLPSCSGSVP